MDCKDIIFDDNAIVIGEILILADMHLGRTDKQSNVYPEPEYNQIYDRIQLLINKYNPSEVVIAGDIFQRIETVPIEAFETLYKIQKLVENNNSELVLVPGNHDEQIIDDLSSIFNGTVENNYHISNSILDNGITVLHGHKTPFKPADIFIFGHLHPVITVDEKTYDCYLFSSDAYYGSSVLILPSFTHLSSGSDVEKANFNPDLIPILCDGDSVDKYKRIAFDCEECRSFFVDPQ